MYQNGYEKVSRMIGQELDKALASIVQMVANCDMAGMEETGCDCTEGEMNEFLSQVSAVQLAVNVVPKTQAVCGAQFTAHDAAVKNANASTEEQASISVGVCVRW